MNAHSRITVPDEDSGRRPRAESTFGDVTPDGSLVITREQLALLGGGDVVRGKCNLRRLLAAEREHKLPTAPATKPAKVRIATVADEAAIFELLMADLKENAESVAPISPERVMAHIQAGTRRQNACVMGVIDGPDRKPVALVLLMTSQWWWSNALYIQEQITYVHPDHRRSNHIDALLQFAKWWTDSMITSFGHRLYMLAGVLGTKRVRQKSILYRRKFRMVGMAFLYPPPPDMED